MSLSLSKQHHRYRDLRKSQHKKEFRTLCTILNKLEERKRMPLFETAEELDDVLVVCGAPFNIDDEKPIDLDPRYFVPGSVDEMNEGLQAEGKPMPQIDPIEYHRLEKGELYDGYDAVGDARRWCYYCERVAWVSTYWDSHRYMKSRNVPGGSTYCRTASNASFSHQFSAGQYRMWPRGEELKDWVYHPDVPHAIGTVIDSVSPRNGAILRSELLFAVSLLKASVRDASMFIDHQVCPILVASFHARFSARILQVYLQNGRMVVRPSRLLNFHTHVVSHDVKLMLRWLNCRPVGDTRWHTINLSLPKEDRGAAEVGPDRDNPPTHAISVL